METTRPSSVKKDRETLAKYLGGSHAYGLNTPESDTDVRVIYKSTSINHIVGLNPDEFTDNRNETEDVFYSEIRYFLELLRRASTNSIECLFTTNFEYIHPSFESLVLANKKSLCDGQKLVASTLGYITSERRLANGERTGKLGSKRKLQLDKYGFSPKNFVNMLRLCWCTREFILTGDYPVCVKGTPIFELLYSIKTTPEKFKVEELNALSTEEEKKLLDVRHDLSAPGYQYTFQNDVVADVLLRFYKPTLDAYFESKK